MVAVVEEKYNGWVNRETWACHLWLTSNEDNYNMVQSMIRVLVGEKKGYDFVETELAKELREWFEDIWIDFIEHSVCRDENTAVMLKDIGSLWRVEWLDVARAFLDDLKPVEKAKRIVKAKV